MVYSSRLVSAVLQRPLKGSSCPVMVLSRPICLACCLPRFSIETESFLNVSHAVRFFSVPSLAIL